MIKWITENQEVFYLGCSVFFISQIIAVDDGRAVPLHKIIPDKIFDNLRTFHAIMSHRERGNFSSEVLTDLNLRFTCAR